MGDNVHAVRQRAPRGRAVALRVTLPLGDRTSHVEGTVRIKCLLASWTVRWAGIPARVSPTANAVRRMQVDASETRRVLVIHTEYHPTDVGVQSLPAGLSVSLYVPRFRFARRPVPTPAAGLMILDRSRIGAGRDNRYAVRRPETGSYVEMIPRISPI